MAQLTSSLVVRLLDQATGPAKGIARSILGIRDAAARAGNMAFGDRLRDAMDRNNAALDRVRGQVGLLLDGTEAALDKADEALKIAVRDRDRGIAAKAELARRLIEAMPPPPG